MSELRASCCLINTRQVSDETRRLQPGNKLRSERQHRRRSRTFGMSLLLGWGVSGVIDADQQCSSPEAGTEVTGGDLRRQCGAGAPFTPCSAPSTAECMRRCARRPRCFAYVYMRLPGLCYLKDAPTALFGTPISTDGGTLMGRCIKRMPTVSTTAVCLSGQPRGFGTTAPSMRTNVLEPWDADAFLVVQSSKSKPTHEVDEGIAGLGPRLRVMVRRTGREILDPAMYRRVLETWSGSKVPRGPNVGGSAGYRGWVLQLLNREACLRTVLHAEVASGTCYRVYARLRLDSLFFLPLPRSMLEAAAAPMVAVVPTGDAWGVEETVGGIGVCDRMLVGGFHAFEADARMWVSFRDNPTFPTRVLPPNYVMETATRKHLTFHGIKVLVLPVAYCTISKAGACRYPEHLSISVAIVGPELLRARPQLCHCNETRWCNLLEPRPCNASQDRFVQTDAMKATDPAFCTLVSACRAAQPVSEQPSPVISRRLHVPQAGGEGGLSLSVRNSE